MWSKEKSVKLTHVMVRIFYLILTVVAAASIIIPITVSDYGPLAFYIVPFYISVPVGYIALVCLDKLLINIKKGIVFDNKNVQLLRIFSWLCFFVSMVTFLFVAVVILRMYLDTVGAINVTFITIADWYYSIFAFCVSVAELFVGVVVRVVKNIFEATIKIKEENELTI
ncbi:MAG: DUF2975 domain-containing protein [Eubacterium sp.]|nr:DUF2975 domain-containing protein [Eubacterium sp.]